MIKDKTLGFREGGRVLGWGLIGQSHTEGRQSPMMGEGRGLSWSQETPLRTTATKPLGQGLLQDPGQDQGVGWRHCLLLYSFRLFCLARSLHYPGMLPLAIQGTGEGRPPCCPLPASSPSWPMLLYTGSSRNRASSQDLGLKGGFSTG